MEKEIYGEVREMLKCLPEIILQLRRNETGEVYKRLQGCMPKLNQIYTSLLAHKAEYEKMGVELPQDVILAQINNMIDGFEYRDIIRLADTLEYEVSDMLVLYKDILEEKGIQ